MSVLYYSCCKKTHIWLSLQVPNPKRKVAGREVYGRKNQKNGGKNMESNKMTGILSIILGLIFIICPVLSSGLVSVMIGVSLIFLGIASIFGGFSTFNIIVGILAVIFGLLFIFQIDALSFLLGIQFYIIGIVIIFRYFFKCQSKCL